MEIKKAQSSISIIGIPVIQKATHGTENANKSKIKEIFLKKNVLEAKGTCFRKLPFSRYSYGISRYLW